MPSHPSREAPAWSIAVFAHNEAGHIAATLGSIAVATHGMAVEVVVLANGCQDGTVQVVRALAAVSPQLRVVEIPLADKANAWNTYVHHIAAVPSAHPPSMHVFVDGDVVLAPGALRALAERMQQVPGAHAVGGMPTTGRDRQGWSQRMLSQGTLAGGLYALRGSFVQTLHERGIRLPQGLVGEDWLVSQWAGCDLQPIAMALDGSDYVVFAAQAGFSFRSLSPWRLRDYRTYLRRLWRYAQRGVQHEMVWQWLRLRLPESLPPDVQTLYAQAPTPSRLLWTGSVLGMLLRCLAVLQVRRVRADRAGL